MTSDFDAVQIAVAFKMGVEIEALARAHGITPASVESILRLAMIVQQAEYEISEERDR